MALRWKPTIPDDNNPDDVAGSLHLHVFARVYRVSNGSDQGRFRWYLNDIPASAGVLLQGIEDTRRKAQQAANLHFQQLLKRAGLREAPVRGKKQLALPFHLSSQSESGKPTLKTKPDREDQRFSLERPEGNRGVGTLTRNRAAPA